MDTKYDFSIIVENGRTVHGPLCLDHLHLHHLIIIYAAQQNRIAKEKFNPFSSTHFDAMASVN